MSKEKISKFFVENLPQTIFVIALIVWVMGSFIKSMWSLLSLDFDNKALLIPFIIGIISGGYLITKQYLKNRSIRIKEDSKNPKSCKKCGKSRTKK